MKSPTSLKSRRLPCGVLLLPCGVLLLLLLCSLPGPWLEAGSLGSPQRQLAAAVQAWRESS